jgi:glucose/arabinose dehydrogenase
MLRIRLVHKVFEHAEDLPWLDLCHPPRRWQQAAEVQLEPAFAGQTFEKPVDVVPVPSQPGTWLVALHDGLILRVDEDGSSSEFADLSALVTAGSQWGLQSVALHPDFAATGELYVAYTGTRAEDVAPGLTSYVARLTSTDGGRSAASASLQVLLSESQRGPWHAVQCLRFGPDGLLYVSWGARRVVEAPDSLRGGLLRIDVDDRDGDRTYGVPADNPALGVEAPPELFARGFRAPWRFSFDRDTGEMWLGDVGQRSFEEINRVLPGRHYGWPRFEADECRVEHCDLPEHEPPRVSHGGVEMCALIGGFVYRGTAMPKVVGQYIYGDHCSGSIWAVDLAAGTPSPRVVLPGDGSLQIGSFAEGTDGELYVVESRSFGNPEHRILRLGAAQERPPQPEPEALSLGQLGCIGSGGFDDPPTGMRRFQLRAPVWADGATSSVFGGEAFGRMYGGQETPRPALPALFLRTLSIDGRPIETQMLVQRADSTWDGYSYAWSESGDDAWPVQQDEVRQLADGSTWLFAPGACLNCHSAANQGLLGVTLAQLDVPGSDGAPGQLERLVGDGVLHGDLPEYVEPLADWRDPAVALRQRARSYLHVHCAPCHRPSGRAAQAGFDLRRQVLLEATGACVAETAAGGAGRVDQPMAALVPGDSQASLLLERIRSEGPDAMPPGRQRIDPVGLALLEEWVDGLQGCESP